MMLSMSAVKEAPEPTTVLKCEYFLVLLRENKTY